MNQFTEVESMRHEATPMLHEDASSNFCQICQIGIIRLEDKSWKHDGK
jgi:hypothetical protein